VYPHTNCTVCVCLFSALYVCLSSALRTCAKVNVCTCSVCMHACMRIYTLYIQACVSTYKHSKILLPFVFFSAFSKLYESTQWRELLSLHVACIYTYTYTQTVVYTHTRELASTYTLMCSYKTARIATVKWTHIHTLRPWCVCAYIHIYTNTQRVYVYIYIHTYIYTHTQTRELASTYTLPCSSKIARIAAVKWTPLLARSWGD
jgi:hypothetical protein